MRKILLMLCVACFAATAFAQKEKTVSVEYRYVVPEDVSRAEAKRIAFERACIQAIGDEFGTIVSQSNSTLIKDGKVDFQSQQTSDVNGEWIQTLDEKYERMFDDNDNEILICKLKGIIREIVRAKIDIDWRLLAKTPELSSEKYDIKGGDDIFLYFRSPSDGYLALYLVSNDNDSVYCLLPYLEQATSTYKIKHDKEYIFFSAKHAEKEVLSAVNPLWFTCEKDIHRWELYCIFSPNEFVKANSMQVSEGLPRYMSRKNFNNWLTKNVKSDKRMQLSKKFLTVVR